MTRVLLLAGLLLAGASSVLAADEERVVKIVTRRVGENIDPNSFAAKPVTLWRMGSCCIRSEEELDAALGLHQLSVVNEPDVWMVNWYTRQGKHIVDPGPTFTAHAPIVISDEEPQLREFEYGREMEFLGLRQVKRSGPEQIQGRECDRYEVGVGSATIVLYTRAGTEIPVFLQVSLAKHRLQLQYDVYETGLAPDPALFQPPADIVFEESR